MPTVLLWKVDINKGSCYISEMLAYEANHEKH